MNQYLGKDVSHIFGSEGYNYSKVVFSKGRPVLDAELNLMQELQENLARRATTEMASGWVSYRDPATSRASQYRDSFLSQSPYGAIPEIALVNGWAVLVSNTASDLPFVNKIDLSGVPLTKGSRADGVFLEVWRGVVSEEFAGTTQPASAILNSSLYSVYAMSDMVGWAVGAHGVILKTDNSGATWYSQVSPTSYDLYSIVFNGPLQGYACGANGTLIRTDNGGASWYKIALATTDDLLCAAVYGSAGACVVGKSGAIFRSQNGVDFLTPNVVKTNDDLKSVFFYDAQVGWAVGANGALVRTQDGGITWDKFSITVPDTNGIETTVTTTLNSVKFVNLNDGWIVGNSGLILKTNDGGLRWANTSANVYDSSISSYRSLSANYNALAVKKSLPLSITLEIHDPSFFKSATYSITPTTVTLKYVRMSDNMEFRTDLSLAQYATDADLKNAINAIVSPVESKRVFVATLGYSESSYESHLNQGSFYGSGSTDMRFSMGDKAWIAGDGGVMLSSTNSGAQWVQEDLGIGFNMLGVHFYNFNYGWTVGENAAVVYYNSSATDQWAVQETDLMVSPQKRVYFEGNVGAAVTKNLNFDSISPDVKVTTADRVQIQYKIRVVEGIDLSAYQEAGLGAPYVYSLGPNQNVVKAGSFPFENMGSIDGDFGLWRARCKNTVDGYTYAIPMFLVSKRNSAPYDPDNNINGSTSEALFVVRPDDLQPGEITGEDIVDIRKSVSTVDTQNLLQGTIDLLMGDQLRTRMSRNPEMGTQVGTSIIYKDLVSNSADIVNLVNGVISAAAVPGITGFIGPITGIVAKEDGTLPTQSDLSFTIYPNSIWHPQVDYYSAKYSGTGNTGIDGYDIPGGFTGVGANDAKFVLGSTGVLNGADNPGLTYVIAGRRIDYSSPGLTFPPDVPMSVRNPDAITTTKTAYYRSVQVNSANTTIAEYPSDASGYVDYVETSASSIYLGSMSSSAVKIHRFQQPQESTNILRVTKEFNGYSCYTISSVRTAAGATYRVKEVRDREMPSGQSLVDYSKLVIYLDDAYRVPAGTVIEIILECNEVPAGGSTLSSLNLGLTNSDRGETSDSFRNPYISMVDKSIKGVEGFYRSALLAATTVSGSSRVDITTTDGSLILGLPSMPTTSGTYTPYVWYTTASPTSFNDPTLNVWYNTVRIDTTVPIEGLGTDIITIALVTGENGISIADTGYLIVPALVQDTKLVNNSNTSYAEVIYRHKVSQTVDSLPSSMSFELLNVSPSMYLSDLGYGGGLKSSLYSNPLKQIGINDPSIATESFFHNLFGLNMAGGLYEGGGILTLPMHLYRTAGKDISLSGPTSDQFGRHMYTLSDTQLLFKAAGMTLPTPRKIFVPMLAKVTSSTTSPVLRGEVVLLVASQPRNTDLDNTLSINSTSSTACVTIYRIPGMPLIRG